MAESALAIPINSTTGSVDGSSERAAIRARELKLRAACEDGDFEQYKELAIETWPMVVGGVSKETKHCADLLNVPDVPMMIVHDSGEKEQLVRRTLLHSACIGGNINDGIVKHLVSVATAAGNRQFIGAADSMGQTAFHVACGNGHDTRACFGLVVHSRSRHFVWLHAISCGLQIWLR